jgi:hypothetical protein
LNSCTLNKKIKYGNGTADATLYICAVDTLGENVLLLKFPTFKSEGNVTDGLEVFKQTIELMHEQSITKIMVDITKNGGGFVGLAYVAMTALTGQPPKDFAHYYTMKKSDAYQNYILVKTPESPSRAFATDATTQFTNPEFYSSGDTTYPEFDPESTYIKPFYFFNSPSFETRQDLYKFIYSRDDVPVVPDSPAKEIIILTNGKCASSCSIFMTGMQIRADAGDNIRVVQYGGQPDKPFDTSTVACNIISHDSYGPNMGFKIMLVNTSADGSGGQFRQFTRFNPNYRMPLWDTKENQALIWSNALEYFGFTQKPDLFEGKRD